VFLEETPRCRSYSKDYTQKQKQKEHHSFKIGTWNVRTLNQGGKFEEGDAEECSVCASC
jgi:NAD-dependent dihydropyrimidine dehydrogenase PreA subunit